MLPVDEPQTVQVVPLVLVIVITCDTALASLVEITTALLPWPDISTGVVAVDA